MKPVLLFPTGGWEKS